MTRCTPLHPINSYLNTQILNRGPAVAKKPQHAEHADEDEDDVDLLALTKRRPAKACVGLTLDETEKKCRTRSHVLAYGPLTLKRPFYSALAQAPDDELLATWRTDEMDVEEYEVADSVLDDNLSVWSEAP